MNESKRIEVENRELFLIGQNTLERYGREQERKEIAKKMLKRGTPIKHIIEDTGLTSEEIKTL